MSDLNGNEECIKNLYKQDVDSLFNLVEPHHAVLQTSKGSIIFSMAIKCSLSFKRAAEMNAAHQMAEVNDSDDVHFCKIGSNSKIEFKILEPDVDFHFLN